MRLRDHLIAAGLALVVMALSLTVGSTPDQALPDEDRTVAAPATP
jgi:hypothetical protein